MRRSRTSLRVGASVCGAGAAICWLLLVVVLTLRLTVLNADFDAAALNRTNAYDRLYTQVLPDPQVAGVTHDLLSGLNVPPPLVLANIRLLLPPTTLREVTHRELSTLTEYLLGERDQLDLLPGLTPVTDNLAMTAATVLRGVVVTRPQHQVVDVAAFQQALDRFVAALAAGHVPHTLPTIPLGPHVADQVTTLVLGSLSPQQRSVLAPQVRTLLASGNLTDALSLIAPEFFAGVSFGSHAFEQQVSQVMTKLQAPAQQLRDRPAVQALAQARSVISLGLTPALIGLLSLSAVLLAGAALLTRAAGGRPARALVITLSAAAITAAVGGLALAATLPDPIRTLAEAAQTPSSAAHLLHDIDHQLRSGMRKTFLLLLVPPLGAATGVAIAPLAVRVVRNRTWTLAFRHRPWTAAVSGLAGTAMAGTAIAVVFVFPSSGPLLCNGSAALCDRSYPDVTYLAAHNAMASSDDLFLNAEQDPDMIGQLNAGVRDLMVDTHYWTTQQDVADYLKTLPAQTRKLLRPVVMGLTTPRPGVWLCHDLCQLGASDAVTQFQRIRDWLAANPHEVITLDIEDHTAPADTERAIVDAGLKPYLLTPPDDPAGNWPTLRQMIGSGHRLVVFSERNDQPGGWFRNLFRYASETPWKQTDPHHLTCSPGRGPRTGKLFLLNHFMTGVAPSRRDAALLNSPADILATARRCEAQRGMHPTFVAVNFATIGDPLSAVESLNGIRSGE